MKAKKAKIMDKAKLKKVQKNKDAALVLSYSDHMDGINTNVRMLVCTPDHETKCSTLIEDMKSKNNKTSKVELDKKL